MRALWLINNIIPPSDYIDFGKKDKRLSRFEKAAARFHANKANGTLPSQDISPQEEARQHRLADRAARRIVQELEGSIEVSEMETRISSFAQKYHNSDIDKDQLEGVRSGFADAANMLKPGTQAPTGSVKLVRPLNGGEFIFIHGTMARDEKGNVTIVGDEKRPIRIETVRTTKRTLRERLGF